MQCVQRLEEDIGSTIAIVSGSSDPPEVGAKTLPEQYTILTTEHLSSPIPPNLLFLLTYRLHRLTCFFATPCSTAWPPLLQVY